MSTFEESQDDHVYSPEYSEYTVRSSSHYKHILSVDFPVCVFYISSIESTENRAMVLLHTVLDVSGKKRVTDGINPSPFRLCLMAK